MFLGEFQHSIDDKGRLTLPAKYRQAFADGLVVSKGLDKCLFILSKVEWPKHEAKMKERELLKKDARKVSRFFFSGSSEESLDKSGRVVVPVTLREYADIEKDVYIVGVSSRLEVWAKHRWEEYLAEAEASYEETAEELAGID